MNHSHADLVIPTREPARPPSAPRRLAGRLTRGPGHLAAPAARWAGIALALAMVVLRRAALLAAGAALLAGTAAGLLVSSAFGLFGFQDSLAVPYAMTSLTVEFTGAAVLVVATGILLAARPRLTTVDTV